MLTKKEDNEIKTLRNNPKVRCFPFYFSTSCNGFDFFFFFKCLDLIFLEKIFLTCGYKKTNAKLRIFLCAYFLLHIELNVKSSFFALKCLIFIINSYCTSPGSALKLFYYYYIFHITCMFSKKIT